MKTDETDFFKSGMDSILKEILDMEGIEEILNL